MRELLTTKDVQKLLQVDRSTIYRMAEAGKLPAVKVGKQWRFPAELVTRFLDQPSEEPGTMPQTIGRPVLQPLAALLPLECVQVIQDAFAEILGATLVVTDSEGVPITTVSSPNAFWRLLEDSAIGHEHCRRIWRDLGTHLTLEPSFQTSLAGLACARAFVRVGTELAGMVVAFGIARADWRPDKAEMVQAADLLELPVERVQAVLAEIPRRTAGEELKILTSLKRFGDVLTHIVGERAELLDRLGKIAALTVLT